MLATSAGVHIPLDGRRAGDDKRVMGAAELLWVRALVGSDHIAEGGPGDDVASSFTAL
jgi:hypothetical protein